MVLLLQSSIEVQDFYEGEPDILAHSAEAIMERVNSGGSRTDRALKALCRREKGLEVDVREPVPPYAVPSISFTCFVDDGESHGQSWLSAIIKPKSGLPGMNYGLPPSQEEHRHCWIGIW